jgi:hypothetical protein
VSNSGGIVASAFLANNYPSAIKFQNLRIQTPTEITLPSLFSLLGDPSAGTPAPVPSGTVPLASDGQPGELLVAVPALKVGDFLTGRLDTSFSDTGFSQLAGTIVIGHQHQNPPVGGTADWPDIAGSAADRSLSSGGSSSPPYAAIACAAIAAALALAAGGWYARRRWLR